MQYRQGAGGDKLSLLGFGCMRFTRRGAGIDKEKAEKEILTAIRGGVNYFDTAYIYPGSEALLGEILEKHSLRSRVFIATKLPHYMIRSRAGIEKTFQEELRRLRTDHIDYYLMHMLTDASTWNKLKAYGHRGVDRGEEGFRTDPPDRVLLPREHRAIFRSSWMPTPGSSARSSTTTWMRIPRQAGPVCSMPMRRESRDDHGAAAGRRRLVNLLPKEAKQLARGARKGRAAAEWAFRWLYDQPEVTVVLSGMNCRNMVKENMPHRLRNNPGLYDRRKILP